MCQVDTPCKYCNGSGLKPKRKNAKSPEEKKKAWNAYMKERSLKYYRENAERENIKRKISYYLKKHSLTKKDVEHIEGFEPQLQYLKGLQKN
jgi:hypothetical protein